MIRILIVVAVVIILGPIALLLLLSTTPKIELDPLASLEEGAMPIVLGGDHSVAAGSVAAAAEWARKTRSLPIGL